MMEDDGCFLDAILLEISLMVAGKFEDYRVI